MTRVLYDKNFEIPGIEIKPGSISNLALGSLNIDQSMKKIMDYVLVFKPEHPIPLNGLIKITFSSLFPLINNDQTASVVLNGGLYDIDMNTNLIKLSFTENEIIIKNFAA